ncbi:formin-like protein 7 isoform X2 [Musa acuminata AAA Group]|uniref:formin-like protein 7 isoform X2 n=1 Tax=Musa acuminata AAA Group TaxID=214697 RepID=UPI0031D2A2A8
MNEAFGNQALVEKLSKLNNSQQSIECILSFKVEIWDERKVFGSRGRSLKDEILGNVPVPVSDNGKSSNPIKLVRKDANSVRIKLAIGEMPEKIVTAYQSVLDEHSGEDTALSKCKDAVQVLERMEIDIDVACKQGNQQESTFIDNLQEQEIVLKQCIEQLEIAKATRATLITQLMEAIKEQELKLELIHSQLQIAHSQTEHASNMRRRVGLAAGTNGFGPTTTLPLVNFASEAIPATEPNPPVSITHLQPLQPVTSFVSSLSSAEEDHKKAAAAVAAKLAASSSSAQVLSSILSSLAAEEAASMNNSLSSRVRPGSPPVFPLEKRPRLENTISTTDMGKTSYFGQAQHQQQQSIPLVLPQTSAANIQLPQSNQVPPTFTPPLPPLPPPPMQQYVQTSGGTMSVPPYGFVGRSLPSPPPLLSHVSAGLARPGGPLPPPPPPPPPQQQQPPPQLQSTSMGFYQSPGIGFYGQPQTTPTAQRQ